MEANHSVDKLIQVLNEEITSFDITNESLYRHLLEKIGDARIVLLGESTHGTQEFYRARILISQLLIKEKGFHAIAIEGDWTSSFGVHQFILGENSMNPKNSKNSISTPEMALQGFNKFPIWMWRNEEIVSLVQWLKDYNDKKEFSEKIGFYGLDLYCLHASIAAVLQYLKTNDQEAFEKARLRYNCFESPTIDPQAYGYLVNSNLKKACTKEAVEQLLDMHHLAFQKLHQGSFHEQESLFYALQNSRLVKNAENYYRALFEAQAITWNIRDHHMAETLQNIMMHIEEKNEKPAKVIIFAHNSHVGDARATEMSERREINLGEIVREQYGVSTFHLGFSTHHGTVRAAFEWDGESEIKNINPGLKGSYEDLFHQLKYKNFLLDLHTESIAHLLQPSRLQRAIGVIYRPESERHSHYFFTHLPHQFDAIMHFDETTAIKPID